MMSDKPKGKPRRRLYLLLTILVFLLVSAFFIAPYAEDRLIAWLDDDPFTSICDAGHLELAFVRDNKIYVVRGNGSDFHIVPESVAVRHLGWSPTGEYLTFTVNFDYYDELFIWNGKDAIRLPDSYRTFGTGWEWSYDGQMIVFNDWNPDSDDMSLLWIVGVSDNQEASILAMGQNLNMPEWSPTASNLLFWDKGQWIMAVSSNRNSVEHSIWGDEEFTGLGMDWSPDGRYLSYYGAGLISVIDANTSDFLLVQEARNIVWSTDGSLFALDYDGEFAVIDPTTSEEIWRFEGRRIYDWSEKGIIYADSDWTATNNTILELRIADVVTQTTSYPFARSTNYLLAYAVWTPDNSKILYTFDNINYYLTLPEADFNGDNRFHIPAEYILLETTWTPDNRYLTYQATNNWLYLLDLETYESCRVVKGDANGITRYDWRIIP